MFLGDKIVFPLLCTCKYYFLEATALLLAHNAPVKSKNKDGWNSLMEAVSYGDRQISKFIFQ